MASSSWSSKATIESRVWLVVIMLIMVVGQIGINRQVADFRSQADHNHVDALKARAIQLAATQDNSRQLLAIRKELIALRSQANATRSSK